MTVLPCRGRTWVGEFRAGRSQEGNSRIGASEKMEAITELVEEVRGLVECRPNLPSLQALPVRCLGIRDYQSSNPLMPRQISV